VGCFHARAQAVEAAVAEVLAAEGAWLKVGRGKMVLELKPNVEWDKGSSVLWLLEALGLKDRMDVFALYIGDDTTDEDAFRVLQVHPQWGGGEGEGGGGGGQTWYIPLVHPRS
jgi:trehalose 6-phosphate phosphatase